jgi:hypothetical protein
MRILIALAAAVPPLLIASLAVAQGGQVMDGGLFGVGWMGGYGGLWIVAPLVLAVFGLVAWAERQKHK